MHQTNALAPGAPHAGPGGRSRQTWPTWLVALVLAASVLPLVLGLLGVDFSSNRHVLGEDHGAGELHQVLRGSFIHTLTEWSAFGMAIFTALLAFMHFSMRRDMTTPIVGMALLCAGAMDAFHTLAATRLILAGTESPDLIPFTWALCRSFNVIILGFGVGIILLRPEKVGKGSLRKVGGISIVLAALAYLTIHICASSSALPRTMFPDALLTRPFDVAPLVMFAGAAYFIFLPFHRRQRDFFSFGLMLSMVPEIATQAHMAFGSTALFDHHFNAAHNLKILAYFVPMVGLCLEYLHTHKTNVAEIARRKESEVALEAAKDAAEAAGRTKATFLANMSHEIRTPMNGVLGINELLLATNLDSDQRELVEVSKRSAEGLLTIINDILDVSKMDTGKVRFERIPIDLDELLGEVVATTRPTADEGHVELTWERQATCPAGVLGDPGRIKQILLNLLGNAVKFSGQSSAGISLISHEVADGEPVRLQFDVWDTGPGISDKAQARLFLAFEQADGSTTRKFGGTGLGLTISKGLATKMGGSLSVSSREGQGSTFSFVVSLDAIALASEVRLKPGRAREDFSELNVLLVEDNAVNQMLAKRFLETFHISPDVAKDGVIGVMKAREKRYDLILMDCLMPRMDGYSATQALREQGGESTGCIIVALTANAMDGDRAKCLAAGMDDYLSKPIRILELHECLSKHAAALASTVRVESEQ